MGNLTTYGLVATAAVLWGANFNLAQRVIVDLHPLAAGAGRFVVAALLMLLIVRLRGEALPPWRHRRAYATLGLVGIGGFNLLFFFGMQSTSAVNGALIMALNPLVTTLLAFPILGERPNARQMLAFPLGAAGVAVVVLGGGARLQVAPGDLLMLGANLAWAGYNVLGRKLMPTGVSGLSNTTGIMVAGALVLLLAAGVSGAPVAMPGPEAGAALLLMAVGGSVLAYLFWNAGLARLGAGRTALFLNLVPVSAMLIAAFEGTPPTLAQFLGGAVVMGAVSLAMLPARRRLAVAAE